MLQNEILRILAEHPEAEVSFRQDHRGGIVIRLEIGLGHLRHVAERHVLHSLSIDVPEILKFELERLVIKAEASIRQLQPLGEVIEPSASRFDDYQSYLFANCAVPEAVFRGVNQHE